MHTCSLKSNWGTCMPQSWIPRFNSKNPNNLTFSTSVTLRNLSYEHCDQAYVVAKTLSEIIGTQRKCTRSKVCVNLKVTKGWVINIALNSSR